MLNITIEHENHKTERIFSLVSHITDENEVYKISSQGILSRKVVLEKHYDEDYDLYVDCGSLMYLHTELLRYSNRAIKINNSDYVTLGKDGNSKDLLLAIRNQIFSDDVIHNEGSSNLDKEACTLIKNIYNIIKVTDKDPKYRIVQDAHFKIYKISFENKDLTISVCYEFQCFNLFNESWFIDEDLSNPKNKVWTYASRYMSRILKDDVSVSNLEELQYYAQIYQTQNY